MIAIDIGKRTFEMPENWAEVIKLGRYQAFIESLMQPGEPDEARWRALQALAAFNGYDIGKEFRAANTAQRHELAELTDSFLAMQVEEELMPAMAFIFDEKKLEPLIECPIPFIQIGLRKYYAPDEALRCQTGEEMEATENAYMLYREDGKEENLHRMVAMLYRPRKWLPDGKEDVRQPMDDAGVAKREKLFANLEPWQLQGILFWYEQCNLYYSRFYDELFRGSDGEPDPLAWSKIIRAIAGDKRGTVNEVRERMTRSEIFFELEQLEADRKASQK